MGQLKAGAAAVAVALGEDCFPNAESTGKHDDVYVRVLILESNRRFVLLSADMPSMFPPDVRYCRQMIEEKTGASPDCIWVTVSHSFSAPHTWPVGDNEQKDTQIPPVFSEKPEMVEVAQRINRAYRAAYDAAVRRAMNSLQDAALGYGVGQCAVNVNRDMWTAEGWWQGVDPAGFVDHTLPVLRVDDLQGRPIAILYNYSCQSSVAAGPIGDMGRQSSADLAGAADLYIEQQFPGCTAIFLPGATGDQVPLYKINYTQTDARGMLQKGGYGPAGYVLLDEQARMLGSDVVRTAASIRCAERSPAIVTGSQGYTVQCQKRSSDMSKMRPSLHYTFEPDGQREMKVEAVLLGEIALVGMLPEMDGVNMASIREESPFAKTIVTTFINGNGKSMPQQAAYAQFRYSAMNSPFVAGSAEKSCAVALELLNRMHG